MARTRSEISELVVLNTGRTDKTSLINSQCDSALKIAVHNHPFNDTMYVCDDLPITENATSVSIASLEENSVTISGVTDIVTARIVEADGMRNKLLSIKNRQWWDREVVNPEDNQVGWPSFGLRFGDNIILNRPVIANLELRLRVSATPVFALDSTECPIKMLDVFVEQYVTAMIYLSLGMQEKYVAWYIMALGRRYDIGTVGGSLLNAILKDSREIAEDKSVMPYVHRQNTGLAVQNLISGHPNNGNTVSWY